LRIIRIVFLLLGLTLLGVIISQTDIRGALALVSAVGWGILVPLLIFLVTFLGDTFCWQVTLRAAPLTATWFARLWVVRMIGEAFNNTLPAGGVGGEPIKAILLNRHFQIDYPGSTASLFAAKTVTMTALVLFLSVGLVLMLGEDRLPPELQWGGGVGLAVLATAIIGFFACQRFGVSSRSLQWLKDKFGSERLSGAALSVANVDKRFEEFYGQNHGRFAASMGIAFAVWVISTIEVYAALHLMGHPVTWTEAWIIEAAVQLARAAAFFIPAGLGALDGTLLVLCTIFTGSPTAGAAVVLLRRLRDILWICTGFALSAALARLQPAKTAS
jgi:uncharacterized protein (TIRG00374 family)